MTPAAVAALARAHQAAALAEGFDEPSEPEAVAMFARDTLAALTPDDWRALLAAAPESDSPKVSDLDAAWARVEALIPSGYRLDLSFGWCIQEHPENLYHASCRSITDYLGYIGHNDGGPTPAAALNALADRLEATR